MSKKVEYSYVLAGNLHSSLTPVTERIECEGQTEEIVKGEVAVAILKSMKHQGVLKSAQYLTEEGNSVTII